MSTVIPNLPWNPDRDEQQRFRSIQRSFLAIALIFGIVVYFLPVTEPERKLEPKVPPRLAKLILQKRELPPPPPPKPKAQAPKPKPKKAVKPKPKPKPKKIAKAKPKPKPKPKPIKREVAKPKTRIVKRPDPEAARKKAMRTGLLAQADDIADIRNRDVARSALNNRPLRADTGGKARTSRRNILTSNATGGSGGINTAAVSRNVGGNGALRGRATTRVQSSAGTRKTGKNTQRRGSSDKSKSLRSVEDLQLVFDKNKGAIYSLYNKALRRDPSLQGRVVLELTIAPSGQVTKARILSSELKAPALERKLLARVRSLNFGSRDVDVTVTTYPIDFLPS